MRGGGRQASLTGTERRALRRIEAALDAEDPMLSALLDGSAGPRCHVEWVLWTCAAMSALLLVFGVAIADATLQSFGFVLLVAALAVLVKWIGQAADGGPGGLRRWRG